MECLVFVFFDPLSDSMSVAVHYHFSISITGGFAFCLFSCCIYTTCGT